ncbi:MAG: hypothetical protein KC458_03170, partial [Dehalococcoidia bacterium]|nr:hypothetical protein [Dehalococcoidia bacterium]
MTNRVARRVGVVALAALLVVALAAFAGTREAGDVPTTEGDGISVSVPLGTTGASGGAVGPGPDATGGSGRPATTTTPGTPSNSVLDIPDIRLTFSAMVAQAGGANPTFTYRAAVEARDAARYELAAELFDLVVDSRGDLAPFATFRAAQMVALAEGPAAAATRYADLLREGGPAERLPTSVHAIAITEGAVALEQAGRNGEALLVLEQVDSLAVSSFTRASALWERARISEAAGVPGWEDLAI